jgi:hypothetical protein
MWFKVFVLLRIPISILCLAGYGGVIIAEHADFDCFAAAINAALVVFLSVVSVRLVQLRKGALRLAGWLLALETIGAVLRLSGAHYPTTRRVVESPSVFAILCVVLVVWILLNVAILYKARSLFTEPANEKPGA